MKKPGNLKTKSGYRREKIAREFLLSFFPSDTLYGVQEVNGFILIKQFTNLIWNVAIYSKEAYLKRKEHQNKFSDVFTNNTRGKSESESK